MKVFISWSGQRSHLLAEAMHWWLKCILSAVEPWMSSADIPKGGRWAQELATQLATTNFGIICVTRENVDSPWLLFEAGALSRWLERAAVATLLLDVDSDDLSPSPLAQFQDTKVSAADIRRLVDTINAKVEYPLDPPRLDRAFELWWPQLEKRIDDAWEAKPTNDEFQSIHPLGKKVLDLSSASGVTLARWLEEFARSLKSRPYGALTHCNVKPAGFIDLNRMLQSWTCPVHPRMASVRTITETSDAVTVEIDACCAFALLVLNEHIANHKS